MENIIQFDKDRKVKPKTVAFPKYCKVEGAAFESVREKTTAFKKARDAAEALIKNAHKELWDHVHEVLPETDRNRCYTIDAEYEDLGFYVVKETDGKQNILSLLKNLMD